jgi:hypothetical protein
LFQSSFRPSDCRYRARVDGALHIAAVFLGCRPAGFGFSVVIHTERCAAYATAKTASHAGILINSRFHNSSLLFLKYNNQQHFECLFSIHCVGMSGRHDDGLSFAQKIVHTVDGDFAHSVQADGKSVAAGFMGADLLTLGKGEQVMLRALFWASVLLTTCPSLQATGPSNQDFCRLIFFIFYS